MDWRDVGIITSGRRHGEGSAIISVLTASHGRHSGLVRGGGSRQKRAGLQPGTIVSVHWSARLEDQLGSLRCEALESSAAALMDDPDRLAALASICALLDWALPERQAYPTMYDATVALLAALHGETWLAAYIHWELILLEETGFALDLTTCAATGRTDDLVWVSPRSGRAVCGEAGAPYADRLLALPAFLLPDGDLPTLDDTTVLIEGLKLSGYFLHHRVEVPQGRPVPDARSRLIERIGRRHEEKMARFSNS